MVLRERFRKWRGAEQSPQPSFDESLFETSFEDLFSMAGAGFAKDEQASSDKNTAPPSFEEVMADLRQARSERLTWLGALNSAFSGLGHGFMHIGCCAAGGAMTGGLALPDGGHFHIGLDGSRIFHEHDHEDEKQQRRSGAPGKSLSQGAKRTGKSPSAQRAENPFAWLTGPEKSVGLSALFAL